MKLLVVLTLLLCVVRHTHAATAYSVSHTSLAAASPFKSADGDRHSGCVWPGSDSAHLVVFHVSRGTTYSWPGPAVSVLNSTGGVETLNTTSGTTTTRNATRILANVAIVPTADVMLMHTVACALDYVAFAGDSCFGVWKVGDRDAHGVPALEFYSGYCDAEGTGNPHEVVHYKGGELSFLGATSDVFTWRPDEDLHADTKFQAGAYRWWSTAATGNYTVMGTIADTSGALRGLGLLTVADGNTGFLAIASAHGKNAAGFDPMSACLRTWNDVGSDNTGNWSIPSRCSRAVAGREAGDLAFANCVAFTNLTTAIGMSKKSQTHVMVYGAAAADSTIKAVKLSMVPDWTFGQVSGLSAVRYASVVNTAVECTVSGAIQPLVIRVPGATMDAIYCHSDEKLYVLEPTGLSHVAITLTSFDVDSIQIASYSGGFVVWDNTGLTATYHRSDGDPVMGSLLANMRLSSGVVGSSIFERVSLEGPDVPTGLTGTPRSNFPSIVYPTGSSPIVGATIFPATLDININERTAGTTIAMVATQIVGGLNGREVVLTPPDDAPGSFSPVETFENYFDSTALSLGVVQVNLSYVTTTEDASNVDVVRIRNFAVRYPVPPTVGSHTGQFDGTPEDDVTDTVTLVAGGTQTSIPRHIVMSVPLPTVAGVTATQVDYVVDRIGNVYYIYDVDTVGDDEGVGADLVELPAGFLTGTPTTAVLQVPGITIGTKTTGIEVFKQIDDKGYMGVFNVTHYCRWEINPSNLLTGRTNGQCHLHGFDQGTDEGEWTTAEHAAFFHGVENIAVHVCTSAAACRWVSLRFTSTLYPGFGSTAGNLTVIYEFADDEAAVTSSFIASTGYAVGEPSRLLIGVDEVIESGAATVGVVYHAVVSRAGVVGSFVRLDPAPAVGTYEAIVGPPSGLAKGISAVACNQAQPNRPLTSTTGATHCILIKPYSLVNVVFPKLESHANITVNDGEVMQRVANALTFHANAHHYKRDYSNAFSSDGNTFILFDYSNAESAFVLARVQIDAPSGYQLFESHAIKSTAATGVFFENTPTNPIGWLPGNHGFYLHDRDTTNGFVAVLDHIRLFGVDVVSEAIELVDPIPGASEEANNFHGVVTVTYKPAESCVRTYVDFDLEHDLENDEHYEYVPTHANAATTPVIYAALDRVTFELHERHNHESTNPTENTLITVRINLYDPLAPAQTGVASSVHAVTTTVAAYVAHGYAYGYGVGGRGKLSVRCEDAAGNPAVLRSEEALVSLSPYCPVRGRSPASSCINCFTGYVGGTTATACTQCIVPTLAAPTQYYGERCTLTKAVCDARRCQGHGVCQLNSALYPGGGCICNDVASNDAQRFGEHCEVTGTACRTAQCASNGWCHEDEADECVCDTHFAMEHTQHVGAPRRRCSQCADAFTGYDGSAADSCKTCADTDHSGAECDKCTNAGVYPECTACPATLFGDGETCLWNSIKGDDLECRSALCNGQSDCTVDDENPLATTCKCGFGWRRNAKGGCSRSPYDIATVVLAAVVGLLLIGWGVSVFKAYRKTSYKTVL
jgi:hypothetical protein